MLAGHALYGAALFTNTGHGTDKSKKVNARSKAPQDLVNENNSNLGPTWQELGVFDIPSYMRAELEEFATKLKSYFIESNYKKLQMRSLEGPIYCGSDVQIRMDEEQRKVLILSLRIEDIWPTAGAELEMVYDLAEKVLPVYTRRGAPMRMFGIKQRGMGPNSDTKLLKVVRSGEYEAFRFAAAVVYAKFQMVERFLVPGHFEVRKAWRCHHVENACCAIPGCEEYIQALACSITKNYFPQAIVLQGI